MHSRSVEAILTDTQHKNLLLYCPVLCTFDVVASTGFKLWLNGENDLEHSLKVIHWLPILAAHRLRNVSIKRAQISKSSEDWLGDRSNAAMMMRVNLIVCGLTLGPPSSSVLHGQPIICIVHYLIPSADIYERRAAQRALLQRFLCTENGCRIRSDQWGAVCKNRIEWAYFISDTKVSVGKVMYRN